MAGEPRLAMTPDEVASLRRENQRLRKIVRVEFIARGMTAEQADAALAEALVIEGGGARGEARHAAQRQGGK
jgi:hypothetical protein